MNGLLTAIGKVRPASWIKISVCAALLFGVYLSALRQLVLVDWSKEDYSYCWLIPFIVLYLIWEKERN